MKGIAMPLRLFVAAISFACIAACQGESAGQPTSAASGSSKPGAGAAAPRDAAPSPTAGPSAPLPSEPPEDACGAGKLGRWLNLLPTATVKDKITAAAGERPIRYYRQGDPITMDFSPARLNVEIGADGRIKRFWCG
jgi:hypothetical protein